jgi:hypothetical protein
MRLVVAFMSGLLAALLEPVKFTWRHLLTWLQGLITGKSFALCSVPCLYMLRSLVCVCDLANLYFARPHGAVRSPVCARAARAHTLAGAAVASRRARHMHTLPMYTFVYLIEPRQICAEKDVPLPFCSSLCDKEREK